MIRSRFQETVLALLVASLVGIGCAGGESSMPPPPETPGGNMGGGMPTKALQVAGSYHVDSTLDPGSGLDGNLGSALATLTALTDGANDPATWLIDAILREIGSSLISSIANAFRPQLDRSLNDELLRLAPDLVTELRSIGQNVTSVSHNLGFGSDLVITGAPPAPMTATHTLRSVAYIVGGTRHELSLAADLGMMEPLARDVGVRLDGELGLSIAKHSFAVTYGRLLLVALDDAILPALDPNARSMSDYFNDRIDCAEVGNWLATQIGAGSPGLFSAACRAALNTAGRVIENEILQLDGPGATLSWQGIAVPIDHDGDRVVEKIDQGRWSGTLEILGQTSTLDASRANAFVGRRVTP